MESYKYADLRAAADVEVKVTTLHADDAVTLRHLQILLYK